MSEHTAKIEWQRGDAEFTYQTYSRNHTVTFANGHVVESSAAADFMGDPEKVDPETMFVASLSNCHMLTFLAIAAKKRLVVESYVDNASGVLGTLENKKMAMTTVTLRPAIVFGGDTTPDAATIDDMHHKSHEHCFIANSVSCAVNVEPA
ncbi:OsmC family protein [Algisphaera agarilytica]|uniref:Organic hydroperoxide reductase OsmC/OhrA n=1 Tax=Algisphaera agarilytica TaxID=1385975 RepID=A0A7X0LLW7_9BACT|nr:OsmC family protein [Algisphaera agarilytica]MBB6430398.1 organic hydroperoxide reductase OsmC/OhrA [Algisphaera agarilytica]